MPRIQLLVLVTLAGCGNDIQLQKGNNLEPAVDILAPDDQSVFTDVEAIDFQGTVADGDGLDDVASVTWESSIDGQIGLPEDAVPDTTGISRVSANLSPGTHTITLTAVDAAGAQGVDSISLVVEVADQDPTAEITSPTPDVAGTLSVGLPVQFVGGVDDPQQAPDTLDVTWTIELQDGSQLILASVPPTSGGTTSATWTEATAGIHQAVLSVTDSDGNSTEDRLTLTVTDAGSQDNDLDGWTVNGGDCADDDPSINPGIVEICGNLIDDDCSGVVDDKDADVDLHVDLACLPTYPGLLPADDCDDNDATVHPGAPESADGIDNDCDNLIDEGTDAYDSDGDCYCAGATCTSSSNPACAVPLLGTGDCDDTNASLTPADLDADGASSCDGDCDDSDPTQNIDDADGDTYSTCDGDCNDNDAAISPKDLDGDGYSVCTGDCDDSNPLLSGADFDQDGFSNCAGDCNDFTAALSPNDADLDGFSTCAGDCNDADPTLSPADVDNDLFSTCAGDCDDSNPGLNPFDGDGDLYSTCTGDCDDTNAQLKPLDGDQDGASSCGGDCNDSNATLNIRDDDGDGNTSCAGDCDDNDAALSGFDGDGDGFSSCDGDCDDNDAAMNPSDADGDGWSTCDGDCDDGDPLLDPSDTDGDGVTSCDGDCDDGNNLAYPGAPDVPDANYADENCDGLDGNAATAAFVSSTGLDVGFCAQLAPCKTVNFAIGVAATLGWSDVYIRAGTYSDVIDVVDGVDLYGGYDTSWTRAGYAVPGHTVTLIGGARDEGALVGGNEYMVLRARNAAAAFYDLVIDAPDAVGNHGLTGKSSFGVHAVGSDLTFERVEILAGNGSPGLAGTNGGAGSPLAPATGGVGAGSSEPVNICGTSRAGGGAAASNPTCPARTAGGGGGQSGTQDTSCGWTGFCSNCSAQSGLAGSAAGVSGVGYGTGGAGGGTCGGLVLAGTGGLVLQGSAGSGGSGNGTVFLDFWVGVTGSVGGAGTDGTGGGGGGGSGGCDNGTDDTGASGGGGGAGGCAGGGATGGGSGGGSFGIYATSSTIDVVDCEIVRGNAGNGGAGGIGGAGQPGGAGGAGGSGSTDSAAGGNGGNGAVGGAGGGGGGGSGGISWGVYTLGSAVTQAGTSFSGPLSGGTGGAGGASVGNAGLSGGTGASGNVGTCVSAGGC